MTDTRQILMKILNNIDNVNKNINDLVNKYLVQINEPCNFPNISVEIDKMIIKSQISKNEIKELVNIFKSKLTTNSKKLLLASDYRTHFLLLVCLVNLRKNKGSNIKEFKYSMLLLLIRNYCNLMNKYFKTKCVDEYFLHANEYLKSTHLFIKHKSVSKALIYLTTQLSDKYRKDIFNYNIDGIFKLIYEARHRLNQSIKSFFNAYLKAAKESKKMADDNQLTTKLELDTKDEILHKVTEQIVTYNIKNNNLIDSINKVTYIKRSILELLVNQIHQSDFDLIKNIYIYMTKDLNDIFVVFKDKINTIKYIRKLMSIKYTKQEVYFKKLIYDLAFNELFKNKNLKMYYDNVNNGGKSNFMLSIALYLGLYLNDFISS